MTRENSKESLLSDKNTSSKTATFDVRSLRWLRSYNNLFFQDQIDFQSLDLPEIVELEIDTPDIAVTQRLTDAFCLAMNDGASIGNGIWKRISGDHHKQFVQDLLNRNYERVADVLAKMFRNRVMYGLRV